MYERNFHRLLGIQYKIQLKFYVDQLFEHCKKFFYLPSALSETEFILFNTHSNL